MIALLIMAIALIGLSTCLEYEQPYRLAWMTGWSLLFAFGAWL